MDDLKEMKNEYLSKIKDLENNLDKAFKKVDELEEHKNSMGDMKE
jgi:hypothetical protein